MARSTPGTRFRRDLLKDLRSTRERLDWVKWLWTRKGQTTVYLSLDERVERGRWHRPREPHEYAENNLDDLKASWAQVDAAITELVQLRKRLAERYHELKGATDD